MMLAQVSVCSRMSAANASGEGKDCGTAAITDFGVPAVVQMPNHESWWKSKPCSLMAGSSGANATRSADVTARMRTLPARCSDTAVFTVSK